MTLYKDWYAVALVVKMVKSECSCPIVQSKYVTI